MKKAIVFIPIVTALMLLVGLSQMVMAGENSVQIDIPQQKVDMDWDEDGRQDQVQANVYMQNWKTADGSFSFGLDDVWTIKNGELYCGRYGVEFRIEILNTAIFTDPAFLTILDLDGAMSQLTLDQSEGSSFTFDALSQVTWLDENPCE